MKTKITRSLRIQSLLKIIHTNICRPFPTLSLSGQQYIISLYMIFRIWIHINQWQSKCKRHVQSLQIEVGKQLDENKWTIILHFLYRWFFGYEYIFLISGKAPYETQIVRSDRRSEFYRKNDETCSHPIFTLYLDLHVYINSTKDTN